MKTRGKYALKDDSEHFKYFKNTKDRLSKLHEVSLIGNELVKCKNQCEGITNRPEEGIVPRCLIFESETRGNEAIVVGLNPGKANKSEQNFLLEHRAPNLFHQVDQREGVQILH